MQGSQAAIVHSICSYANDILSLDWKLSVLADNPVVLLGGLIIRDRVSPRAKIKQEEAGVPEFGEGAFCTLCLAASPLLPLLPLLPPV